MPPLQQSRKPHEHLLLHFESKALQEKCLVGSQEAEGARAATGSDRSPQQLRAVLDEAVKGVTQQAVAVLQNHCQSLSHCQVD